MPVPKKLQRFLDAFALVDDRSERINLLIDIADRFREVPASIATRPFPRARQTPHCESEAYVWVEDAGDDALDLHFAVENPQGISARAMAVILQESLSGETAASIAQIPGDLPNRFFGSELSMGKTMGLTGMVAMVKNEAMKRVARGE